MSYGQPERNEITAQMVLAALIAVQGNANNIPHLAKVAWDVAEIFQAESDRRFQKYHEHNSRRNS